MPLGMIESVCRDLRGVATLRLNYSGESVNHPQFDRALELAAGTGAQTELVTALASIPATHLRALVDHHLSRLSVSLHTLDPEQYQDIYRFSSVEQLREKIAEVEAYKRRRGSTVPELDFSFVAMRRNLNQLPAIAEYAQSVSIRSITIHPVIRRDPADADVSWELSGPQQLHARFARDLKTAVQESRRTYPDVAITVSRPLETVAEQAESHAFTCEQNPFETTHILSDGRVVPCEVLDSLSLGCLSDRTFPEIWEGTAYRAFRKDYTAGQVSACRACEFRKPVFAVGVLVPAYGWHEADGSGAIWSRSVSEARLLPCGTGMLRVEGTLPQASFGENCLEIRAAAGVLARVRNKTGSPLPFSIEFPHWAGVAESLLTFTVLHPFSAAARGEGPDIRELGFALTGSTWTPANTASNVAPVSLARKAAVHALLQLIEKTDRAKGPPLTLPPLAPGPGISVLIPARGPEDLLVDCLRALQTSLEQVEEPWQITVLVSGSSRGEYQQSINLFPGAEFRFCAKPLGFSPAVTEGLRTVRYPWVYLLNSDVALDPAALAALLPHRARTSFALGSRIFLSGGRTFETGFTSLQIAFGRAQLLDVEPAPADSTADHYYCSGGSSLFQTATLRHLAGKTRCYDPFYWEDAEWGVSARAAGLKSRFVAASTVQHLHRGTINRFYTPEEIDRVMERNRLLFEMRCLPDLLDPGALRHSLEHASPELFRLLAHPRTMLGILRQRRMLLAGKRL